MVSQIQLQAILVTFPKVMAVFYIANIGKDLIGIKTTPQGQPVYFTNAGTDNFSYSIKTQRFAETTLIDRIDAIVRLQFPTN